MYDGIIFLGQSFEYAGRGIGGYRLRTAAQQAGFNILIVDFAADINKDQIFSIIEHNIDITSGFVGFSTSWIEDISLNAFKWANNEFFTELKSKFSKVTLITGGHDVFGGRKIIKHSEYHFNGFSDRTFVEFLKMRAGQTHRLSFITDPFTKVKMIESDKTDPVTDPDQIETVLVKEDGFLSFQAIPIELSRGCIFRCAYCRHPFQGKKDYDSYQRTPNSIARELSRNYELFGTTRYTIMDDTFNDSLEKIDRLRRAIDIAKLPNFEYIAYIRPEMLVTQPDTIKILCDIGLRGAFVGIESFHPSSRMAVGRGMKIDRVLDACFKLASESSNKALVHASFIVGLPEETPDDIMNTQEFLINNRNSLFRSWFWQRLGIRNTKKDTTSVTSTIEQNFEKYGYVIKENSNQWSNTYFNSNTAQKLTDDLNNKSQEYIKFAGWQVAGCWQINMSDEEIQAGTAKSKKELYHAVKLQSIARATSEVARLTKNRNL